MVSGHGDGQNLLKSSFDCSKPTKRGINDYGVMETCELRQKFGALPQKQPKLVVTEPITEKTPPKQVTFDPKKPPAQPKPASGLNFNPKPLTGNALFTNAVQEPAKKTQPGLFPLPSQPPTTTFPPPQTASQYPAPNPMLPLQTTTQPTIQAPQKTAPTIPTSFDLSKSQIQFDHTSPIKNIDPVKNITPIIKKIAPIPENRSDPPTNPITIDSDTENEPALLANSGYQISSIAQLSKTFALVTDRVKQVEPNLSPNIVNHIKDTVSDFFNKIASEIDHIWLRHMDTIITLFDQYKQTQDAY